MAHLLVSVRSADEAKTAAAAGADIIDVKEPSRGPLGRADDAMIQAVVAAVGPRPVSVALGEIKDLGKAQVPPLDGVGFAKVGPAGCATRSTWRTEWHDLGQRVADSSDERTHLIAAAYADAERAGAPSVTEMFELNAASQTGVLLVDTWAKDGRSLLDWLSVGDLSRLSARCKDAGLRLALAGSIGLEELGKLAPVAPAIVAVRGAACRGRRRDGIIEARQVRRLALDLAAIGNTPPAVLVES
jgi:uncharacterized protein (UPF0264 family)